jgi:hypothetical protein
VSTVGKASGIIPEETKVAYTAETEVNPKVVRTVKILQKRDHLLTL